LDCLPLVDHKQKTQILRFFSYFFASRKLHHLFSCNEINILLFIRFVEYLNNTEIVDILRIPFSDGLLPIHKLIYANSRSWSHKAGECTGKTSLMKVVFLDSQSALLKRNIFLLFCALPLFIYCK